MLEMTKSIRSRPPLRWLFLAVCLLPHFDGYSAVSTGSATDAAKLFANFYEEQLKLYPLTATFAGDNRYNDQLPNTISDSFRATEKAFFEKHLTALRALSYDKLTQEEQISYEILREECERQLEQLRFPTHLTPLSQFHGLHLTIGQLGAGKGAQPFRTPRDYENWLKRLEAFKDWCHTALANMKTGITQGYVLPKPLTVKLIPQIESLAQTALTNHIIYSPIREFPPTVPQEVRARLAAQYTEMIEEKLKPVLQQLASFLKQEYLPASRETCGISAVPSGEEFYRAQVRKFTTLDLTPDEIHQLGLREVERITKEMEKTREQVGYTGDLKSFLEHLRKRPELMPFTRPEEVIENFHAIHRRMRPHVSRLFNIEPRTPFEIRRTEAFREASASPQWVAGALDGSRPGIFYVPIPNARAYNVLSDEAIFLHEAIPGHHYERSLQRENTSLPMFRRTIVINAFAEGWGLYCESLGKEVGLYLDPYQYMGMLSLEMHRAIRLVVDTGIHAKGWTRERAIQYSLEREAWPEAGIVSEIERYIAWPGQALCYKVGQLKIQELRARAEKAHGPRFDIRQFHMKALESGSMPLGVFERKIDRWIAQGRTDGRASR